MARKTLPMLVFAGLSLLGVPASMNAEHSSSAHQVGLNVPPIEMRILRINENDEITTIDNMGRAFYLPENEIIILKNGSRIPMNPKIREQYNEYLNRAAKYGMNWGEPGWHRYKLENGEFFESSRGVQSGVTTIIQDEPLGTATITSLEPKEEKVIEIRENGKIISQTFENGVLYKTITDGCYISEAPKNYNLIPLGSRKLRNLSPQDQSKPSLENGILYNTVTDNY